MSSYYVAAIVLIALVLIGTVIAAVSRVLARRKRAALAATMARHPAGKGRPNLDDSRRFDRPGFDWTSDTL